MLGEDLICKFLTLLTTLPNCSNFCQICSVQLSVTGFYEHYDADINECQSSGKNVCEQICVNTDGSYRCECRPGFRLHVDGRTCISKYCLCFDAYGDVWKAATTRTVQEKCHIDLYQSTAFIRHE